MRKLGVVNDDFNEEVEGDDKGNNSDNSVNGIHFSDSEEERQLDMDDGFEEPVSNVEVSEETVSNVNVSEELVTNDPGQRSRRKSYPLRRAIGPYRRSRRLIEMRGSGEGQHIGGPLL
ncbi:hypothetical protein SESBI_01293 [Sesbania bispinosa]|nr:hypothetical protein SESBI_01293 [Sesbania bispinosa]